MFHAVLTMKDKILTSTTDLYKLLYAMVMTMIAEQSFHSTLGLKMPLYVMMMTMASEAWQNNTLVPQVSLATLTWTSLCIAPLFWRCRDDDNDS